MSKTIKRILALALALSMVACLAAGGGNTATGSCVCIFTTMQYLHRL